MTSQLVLIVEDDAATRTVLSAAVRAIGDVEVATARNGAEGLAFLRANRTSLVLADVNMPELDGLGLLERLRAEPALSRVPVLLLTARGDTIDKYRGFEAGADDYLAKPFDVIELQLRLKALLRRRLDEAGAPAASAPKARVRCDERRGVALVDDATVRLTASELALLRHVLAHPDRWLSVRDLLSVLGYGPGAGAPHVVHTHIRNMRQKLRAAGLEEPFPQSSKLGYMVERAWLEAGDRP
jgi:DNA-binding response OmpR family regulator